MTTDQAEYCLQLPFTEYEPFMEQLGEKATLTKLVIGVLGPSYEDAQHIEYDDLVSRVSEDAARCGLATLSTDVLLKHAEFLINQVREGHLTAF